MSTGDNQSATLAVAELRDSSASPSIGKVTAPPSPLHIPAHPNSMQPIQPNSHHGQYGDKQKQNEDRMHSDEDHNNVRSLSSTPSLSSSSSGDPSHPLHTGAEDSHAMTDELQQQDNDNINNTNTTHSSSASHGSVSGGDGLMELLMLAQVADDAPHDVSGLSKKERSLQERAVKRELKERAKEEKREMKKRKLHEAQQACIQQQHLLNQKLHNLQQETAMHATVIANSNMGTGAAIMATQIAADGARKKVKKTKSDHGDVSNGGKTPEQIAAKLKKREHRAMMAAAINNQQNAHDSNANGVTHVNQSALNMHVHNTLSQQQLVQQLQAQLNQQKQQQQQQQQQLLLANNNAPTAAITVANGVPSIQPQIIQTVDANGNIVNILYNAPLGQPPNPVQPSVMPYAFVANGQIMTTNAMMQNNNQNTNDHNITISNPSNSNPSNNPSNSGTPLQSSPLLHSHSVAQATAQSATAGPNNINNANNPTTNTTNNNIPPVLTLNGIPAGLPPAGVAPVAQPALANVTVAAQPNHSQQPMHNGLILNVGPNGQLYAVQANTIPTNAPQFIQYHVPTGPGGSGVLHAPQWDGGVLAAQHANHPNQPPNMQQQQQAAVPGVGINGAPIVQHTPNTQLSAKNGAKHVAIAYWIYYQERERQRIAISNNIQTHLQNTANNNNPGALKLEFVGQAGDRAVNQPDAYYQYVQQYAAPAAMQQHMQQQYVAIPNMPPVNQGNMGAALQLGQPMLPPHNYGQFDIAALAATLHQQQQSQLTHPNAFQIQPPINQQFTINNNTLPILTALAQNNLTHNMLNLVHPPTASALTPSKPPASTPAVQPAVNTNQQHNDNAAVKTEAASNEEANNKPSPVKEEHSSSASSAPPPPAMAPASVDSNPPAPSQPADEASKDHAPATVQEQSTQSPTNSTSNTLAHPSADLNTPPALVSVT